MTNENCLEGIRCPKCGSEESFLIVATVLTHVTDDGAEISERASGFEWDDSSATCCGECNHCGPLGQFQERQNPPPDPEGMNEKRARWASAAISAFMADTGTDRRDAVTDLLADLMHWCDRNRMAFDAQLDRARSHYEAETSSTESTL